MNVRNVVNARHTPEGVPGPQPRRFAKHVFIVERARQLPNGIPPSRC